MTDTASPPERTDPPISGPPVFGPVRIAVMLVVALAVLATLLSLGAWQVERLRWKEGIVATIDARIHSAPLAVEEVEAIALRSGDVDYVPVTARGAFLHDGERYFLATLKGQAGWHVYTPLALAGSDKAIFVNRGFVPYEAKDPATRPLGQVEGLVTVEGLARNPAGDNGGWFIPKNDPASDTYFTRDVAAMSAGLSLPSGTSMLPFFIDAGPGAAPGGIPVGGVTVVDIPNNHLQYAITWFGLAAVLVVMLGVLLVHLFRSRRRRPA